MKTEAEGFQLYIKVVLLWKQLETKQGITLYT